MDWMLTEEQKELQQMIAKFGKNEVLKRAQECDRTGEFPTDLYNKALEMGLHMIDLPEKFGGGGFDPVTAVIVQEELAKYDAGFSVSLFASGLAAKPLLIAGTDRQIQMFTDILAQGKMAAFCLTEPQAGSDAGASQTTAVRDGGGYVLNGRKCFITTGGMADVYVVFAMTDKSKGVKGMSAFIVERGAPGVSVGKEEDKMGIRLSNTTDVVFEDVRVPAENLIGAEGEGFKLAMKTLDMARPSCGAAAVGICQAAIDLCRDYALQRKTFGRPIAVNQAIQFKLADMEIATETSRQYVRYVAGLIKAGKPHSTEAAVAKAYASDSAVKVTQEAVQIFGGYGYSREYPVEKLYRDAKIFQIFEGTNEIQRMVIAGNVLKQKA